MIIYGMLTDSSVPQLYLAGFIPGFVLAAIFSATVALLCWIRPEWGGVRQKATWSERLGSLTHLLPPLFIFLVVVGSIYAGLTTPTEAAAVGVVAALGLAALYRSLTWKKIGRASCRERVCRYV